jgi:hypothetical protein
MRRLNAMMPSIGGRQSATVAHMKDCHSVALKSEENA